MIRFHIDQHRVMPGRQVIEVFNDDELLATITPGDDLGVRITTKHPTSARITCHDPMGVHQIEFRFKDPYPPEATP